MKQEGEGIETGREGSIRRGDELHRLEDALADVDFPVRRDDLIEEAGDAPVNLTAGTKDWTLRDVLMDIPVDEFSSPQHVAEAVRIRWDDMADSLHPGGTGDHKPYGPSDSEEHTGEKLQDDLPEYDDATHVRAARDDDRKAGP